jgi:hypothetical protein
MRKDSRAPGVSLLGLSHENPSDYNTLLFLVYERLDSESPNKSPSMAKSLPWREPEPAKTEDQESRHKKTSSQASVPKGLA